MKLFKTLHASFKFYTRYWDYWNISESKPAFFKTNSPSEFKRFCDSGCTAPEKRRSPWSSRSRPTSTRLSRRAKKWQRCTLCCPDACKESKWNSQTLSRSGTGKKYISKWLCFLVANISLNMFDWLSKTHLTQNDFKSPFLYWIMWTDSPLEFQIIFSSNETLLVWNITILTNFEIGSTHFRYRHVWEIDREDTISVFVKKKPNLKDFEDELCKYSMSQSQLTTEKIEYRYGSILIDCAHLVSRLLLLLLLLLLSLMMNIKKI